MNDVAITSLSTYALGRLMGQPTWAVQSPRWRLAEALAANVGRFIAFDRLHRLVGRSKSGMLNQLRRWRAAGVLRSETIRGRGRRCGLIVHSFRRSAVEVVERDAMIRDILEAMRQLGEPATPYRIAKAAGWTESSVRRLLDEMAKACAVHEVEPDLNGRRWFILPGGWS